LETLAIKESSKYTKTPKPQSKNRKRKEKQKITLNHSQQALPKNKKSVTKPYQVKELL
jgi:hypothetical protein